MHLWLSPRSSPHPGRRHHRRSRRSGPRSDSSAPHPCEIAGNIRSATAEAHPAHSSTRKVKITSTCTRGARSGLRNTRHRRRSEASQGSQDPAPGPRRPSRSPENEHQGAPKSGPFLFAFFLHRSFQGTNLNASTPSTRRPTRNSHRRRARGDVSTVSGIRPDRHASRNSLGEVAISLGQVPGVIGRAASPP